MKTLFKKLVPAILLIVLGITAIPVLAQETAPQIPAEALQEKERLLAEYEAALEQELSHGKTAISEEDGSTILVGESAEKMDQLWQETVRQVEAAIARPASERVSIESKISAIDGNQPIYVSRSGFPYNPSVAAEKYQTGKYFYTVDIATEQILEIMPIDSTRFRPEANDAKTGYTQVELEEIARTLIKTVAGDVKFQALQPVFTDKSDRYFFFRWEDPASTLPDGMVPFIQVGLSARGGELLNYVNTLPSINTQTQVFLDQLALFPFSVLASFNETYANGRGYFFWQNGSGSETPVSNAGYCYIAGWCSPKNFVWGYTDATTTPQNEPYMKAYWDVNPGASQYIYLKAFIPGTNATAYSRYTATYNNGSNSESVTIDQEIFSDVWASVLGPHFNYGVVRLDNNDDIAGYKVAWDEVLLCTSDRCP